MPDIGSQRAAIATALAGVTGLRVDAEGLWPDRTNLPSAQIVPADTSSPMNLTMTAWDEAYDLTVLVTLAAGLTRGQRALDDFYDSVITALVDNLAGPLKSVGRQSYGVLEVDGAEFLGFVLRLEMIG